MIYTYNVSFQSQCIALYVCSVNLLELFIILLSLLISDRLNERLDFMLCEGLTENSYLNTITAHTGYWANADCVMYVLLQLYSYINQNIIVAD